MRIQQLKLENFRGFEDLTIDFPEKGSAVLIGVNGAGKSSVLEAVGVLLTSILSELSDTFIYSSKLYSSKDDIKFGKSSFQINVVIEYESIPYSVKFSLDKNNEIGFSFKKKMTGSNPFFAHFHSNRIMFRKNENILFNPTNEFITLTTFENFIDWFESRENLENQQKLELQNFNYVDEHLDTVRRALISFLNEISNTHFSDLKMKRYKQNGKEGFSSDVKSFLSIKKNGQLFKINQLSDGEKMSIMMVCDTARKLTIANPNYKNPLEGNGIVLIDEIDLHLHPAWQQAIIPALEKTFPNIQFIVTTHSPQVLSTVKKENVFILEDFKLVKETPHTFGQDSNSILYNIFGIEERPEQAAKDFKKLYRLIDDEKLEEAEKVLEEMGEKYGHYDTEIVRAKMHLDFNHQ